MSTVQKSKTSKLVLLEKNYSIGMAKGMELGEADCTSSHKGGNITCPE